MNEGWTGDQAIEDVYIYIIRLKTKNNKSITKNGTVRLIR